MSEIKVPIVKVRPNPYQPETRVNVSEEDAKWFGESILQHRHDPHTSRPAHQRLLRDGRWLAPA